MQYVPTLPEHLEVENIGVWHIKEKPDYILQNPEIKKQFDEWLTGDDVLKICTDHYKEHTSGYSKPFTLKQIKKYFVKEFILPTK